MATVLLIPHVDAGDRTVWTGDHDVRPLSELGRRQAEELAEALASRSITALYASRALRARQTLEPLAQRLRLTVVVDPGLTEKQLGEDRPTMARRGWEGLQRFAKDAGEGIVAAASHGDMIPALVDYLAKEYNTSGVPDITRRGQWYEIEIEDRTVVGLTLSDGPEDFPLML
jgi:broad specificity phosphatase PhoE